MSNTSSEYYLFAVVGESVPNESAPEKLIRQLLSGQKSWFQDLEGFESRCRVQCANTAHGKIGFMAIDREIYGYIPSRWSVLAELWARSICQHLMINFKITLAGVIVAHPITDAENYFGASLSRSTGYIKALRSQLSKLWYLSWDELELPVLSIVLVEPSSTEQDGKQPTDGIDAEALANRLFGFKHRKPLPKIYKLRQSDSASAAAIVDGLLETSIKRKRIAEGRDKRLPSILGWGKKDLAVPTSGEPPTSLSYDNTFVNQIQDSDESSIASKLSGTITAVQSVLSLEQKVLYGHGSTSLRRFSQLWRYIFPKRAPRPGYGTLKWTCTCGQRLSGEYRELEPGSLDLFYERLLKRKAPASGSPLGSSGSGSSPTPSSQRSLRQNRATTIVGWNQPPADRDDEEPNDDGHEGRPPKRRGNRDNNDDDSDDYKSEDESANQNQPAARQYPRAIELSIRSSKYSYILKEVKALSECSDGALFQQLRQAYLSSQRSHLPLWIRLRVPCAVTFIKFQLSSRPFVSRIEGTAEQPSIPPAKEVRDLKYHYDPCPIDTPPMDSDTFLHYLLTPAEKHPDIIWGPRLPYRLGESLAEPHTPLAQAWGIQISESINHALVASVMFIILLLSGLIAGLYAWATRDNQSAIAIGTWLTTVQAMGLTAIYLWKG